jgi:drug/metabolite transporter (DMT)-like permease
MRKRSTSREGTLGLAALAVCALLWSLAGLFIKLIDWNPLAIAGARSLIAGIFLLVWIRKPRFTFSLPQMGAALASSATMLLFVYANKATTSANAILLQYGAPIYTAIISIFLLKERPRAEHILAFVAVAAGMVLFFLGDLGGGSLLGNLAGVASGITFAFYYVFLRMQKDGSPLESNLLAHGFTAVIALIGACFLPAPRITGASVAAIVTLGVFQVGLAAVFLSYGIKRVTAIQGILVAAIEPIANPIWVFLATGEAPGMNSIAGGAIIITAVLASAIVSMRRDAQAAERVLDSGSGTPMIVDIPPKDQQNL